MPISGIPDLLADDFPLLEILGVGEDAAEDLLDDGLLAVESDDPDEGALPFVLEIDLGQGDVVPPRPVLETAKDAPFVLEGTGVGEK
jgi:hypothetical protein